MKRFLLAYRHLIVLIWLVIILVIFKIINNFVFKNGTSLVFVGLLMVVPLFIYIFTLCNRHQVRNKKKNLKKVYYDNLLEDIKNGHFESSFLKRVHELDLQYTYVVNENIHVQMEGIAIIFDREKTTLHIDDTLVEYRFYYASRLTEVTKYDLRNLQYKNSLVLYTKIIEQIITLVNHQYAYTQNNKEIKLIRTDNNEVVYYKRLMKHHDKMIKKNEIISL